MRNWFSKQRWHFIYGLMILVLLAGTIWQRVVIVEQKVLVKALSEHIVKDHMQMVQHMHEAHGVAPQQERF